MIFSYPPTKKSHREGGFGLSCSLIMRNMQKVVGGVSPAGALAPAFVIRNSPLKGSRLIIPDNNSGRKEILHRDTLHHFQRYRLPDKPKATFEGGFFLTPL
ncbi:hypothetical protein DVH26_09705 [Paenibacillus sp. H1-7]|nr:hypothetical protein DVH26_09705 [Paenibacillus sp. H1-7]